MIESGIPTTADNVLLEYIRRFNEDCKFFESHRKQLRREFLGKWVAVYDGRIVATDDNPLSVLARVEQKGIPPAWVSFNLIKPGSGRRLL